jgi:hypothetical protein
MSAIWRLMLVAMLNRVLGRLINRALTQFLACFGDGHARVPETW